MVDQLLVLLVEVMVVMVVMVVVLLLRQLHLILSIESEEVVEVDHLTMVVIQEDQVDVEEEHLLHKQMAEQQHNLLITQVNQLTMDNLVGLIKILVQELLVVLVGHQLVVEDVVKQDSVLQLLDPCNK